MEGEGWRFEASRFDITRTFLYDNEIHRAFSFAKDKDTHIRSTSENLGKGICCRYLFLKKDKVRSAEYLSNMI